MTMQQLKVSDILAIPNHRAIATAINTFQFSQLTTADGSYAFYYAGPGPARIASVGVFVGETVADGDSTITFDVYHNGTATEAVADITVDATYTAGGAVVVEDTGVVVGVDIFPGDVIVCTTTASTGTPPTETVMGVVIQVAV